MREPDVRELERLRMVEAAARRFLEAAQLESMTKAPEYIKAKRALRRSLGVESKETDHD